MYRVETDSGRIDHMTTPAVAPVWVARVDEILTLKDRSWSWLARKLGLDVTSLSRIKNGRPHGLVDDLDTKQRELVSQILEVPMGWIFQE